VFAGQCSGSARDALALSEFDASGFGTGDKLIVSGRIVAADCKPLSDALVEVWHAGANGNPTASAITDADGRFMFETIAPTGSPARRAPLSYRVSHKEHPAVTAQLYLAREPGIPGDAVARSQRDDAGVWRTTFGVTVT
jgi:protocatechuate 3,4-dioxygenase beta subunit